MIERVNVLFNFSSISARFFRSQFIVRNVLAAKVAKLTRRLNEVGRMIGLCSGSVRDCSEQLNWDHTAWLGAILWISIPLVGSFIGVA